MGVGPILKNLLWLAGWLVPEMLCAQVAYHNFNSNDGLPSNEVYCVHQDREGYLWFGTDHGVVKYNGYNFKTFTTADGLTDNTIFSIKEDDDGQLWFLTLAGGICYFDGSKFLPHPRNDTIIGLFTRQHPTSWEVFNNKLIWLGLVNLGFSQIGPEKVESYLTWYSTSRNYAYDSISLHLLILTASKYIYTSIYGNRDFSIRGNKNILDDRSFSVGQKDWRSTSQNFILTKLKDNELLMAENDNVLYLRNNKIQSKLSLPIATKVTQLRLINNQLWMSAMNLVPYSFSLDKNEFHVTDSVYFNNSTSDIFRDRQGNYWFTSLNKGIYLVPNKRVAIFHNKYLDQGSKIGCFTADSNHLYVALPDGKILKIGNALSSGLIAGGDKAGKVVTAIVVKKDGTVISSVTEIIHSISRFSFNIVKIIEIGKDEFIAGGPLGIALIKNNDIAFNSRKIHFQKRVTTIAALSPGNYLIGTITGLYYFNSGNHEIREDKLLRSERITNAKSLNQSVFAVSTRGKGVYINIENKFHNISEANGLVSNLTEDLYFENDSTLWVASFKGLSKINFLPIHDSLFTKIRNYTKEDGLCSDQINVITGFNGFIWLGTNEGLCYFRPVDLSDDTLNIPFYFGNIYVNGDKKSPDSLDLRYDQNNFLIEFNAIYYKAVSGIRYKVRLKGRGGWKFTNQNFIQYFNLPAGNYELQVAADDKFGKYRSEIRSLRFIIHPRFIDTILFKSLIALFFVLIAGIIIYLVFNFERLKAQNVIKLLQAEFKALNYQINPHFIFNVLNSIQYYVLKKDTGNAVQMLSSFSTLIRKIVNNSKQQYVSVLDEVECLKEYLDLEKMRLDNKFEYEINIDSSIDIEKKDILPMILQPLVENSIWHGIVPSEKTGKIKIDFKEHEGKTVCIVDDNGVGIHYKNINKIKSNNNLSLAMKNVSERLKIISELNDSSWLLKTEDKNDLGEGESGTVITIIFPAIKNIK